MDEDEFEKLEAERLKNQERDKKKEEDEKHEKVFAEFVEKEFEKIWSGVNCRFFLTPS